MDQQASSSRHQEASFHAGQLGSNINMESVSAPSIRDNP